MMASRSGKVFDQLRRLLEDSRCPEQTDAQLLNDFVARRDGDAFGRLMARHAALVWRTCRRMLPREHDAEDAFQATFLVLARRANSIRKAESVGGWLYRVAYRVAVKARSNARKRLACERQALARPSAAPPDLAWCELQTLLDEEVQRLPGKYRAPFVLCCLEGQTRDEAARALGFNDNTISSRIARARRLLQERLARRGVTLSAALCACALWRESAAAAVPAELAPRVIAAISGSASVSATVSALAAPALRALTVNCWHGRLWAFLLFGLLIGSAGITGDAFMKDPEAEVNEVAVAAPALRTDLHGDPLPRQAVARLGTARQRAADSHVTVSADGREIITLSRDLVVRRFDARNGEPRSMRQLPGARPNKTWLSPRGAFAVLSYFNRPKGYRLELWDLSQLERRAEFTLENCIPEHTSFSGDERRVGLIGSNQRKHQVLIWDWPVDQARVIWSLEKQIDAHYLTPVVALSSDGKYVVACHLDRELRAWEVAGGKLLWEGKQRNWSPFVLISPDGRTVATTSGVNTGLAVYDLVTGDARKLKHALPKNQLIVPIGFTPDSQAIVFESGHEEIIVWELETGRIRLQLPRPPRRLKSDTLVIPSGLPTNFAFTPDGSGLVRRAGTLQRWELATGKAVFADTENSGHTDEVTRLVFAPDGRCLASTSRDQTVRCWDVATARTKHTIPTGLSNHLAFLPDGRHLMMASLGWGNSVLTSWNVATGKPGREFALKDRTQFMTAERDKELRVTADGKKILMLTWKNGKAGDESVMSAWDVASGDCLQHKRVPWGEQSVFTPVGTGVLAIDSRSGVVRLLDADGETVQRTFESETARDARMFIVDGALTLSPDGRQLAWRIQRFDPRTAAREYEVLQINDVPTGRIVKKLPVEGPAVFTFSVDNRLFALAGADCVRIWETATWKEIGTLTTEHPEMSAGGRSFATAMAFGPDGRTLATGHADCTILLWDATLRYGTRGVPLTVSQCAALWDDLAGEDAARAYAAVWKLADDPQRALPLVREKLKPIAPAQAELMEALLKELEDSQYAVRQRATQQLRDLGDAATPRLRQALKSKLSLEQRRRIEAILEEPPRPISSEELRAVRSVQVLEAIASAEAEAHLARLAQGVESARQTQAAQDASARLQRKPTTVDMP